jgi:hypothetical protein
MNSDVVNAETAMVGGSFVAQKIDLFVFPAL